MQQHPLIGLGRSRTLRTSSDVHPRDIAQPDHLSLDGRQIVDRLAHDADRLRQASSRSSGSPRQSVGNVDHPPGHVSRSLEPRLGHGRTRHPDRSATTRTADSVLPAVRASWRCSRGSGTSMSCSDDRPSNLSSPCKIPSHASCTTSSATACDDTYIRAIRSIIAWCCSTSIMNASSSPARRRSTRSRSSGEARSSVSVTAQEPSRYLLAQVARFPDQLGDVDHHVEARRHRRGPNLAGHGAHAVVQPPVALIVGACA